MESRGESLVSVSEWLATWMPNAVVTDARASPTIIGSAITAAPR